MVGYGWIWFGMVRCGWVWLGMVRYGSMIWLKIAKHLLLGTVHHVRIRRRRRRHALPEPTTTMMTMTKNNDNKPFIFRLRHIILPAWCHCRSSSTKINIDTTVAGRRILPPPAALSLSLSLSLALVVCSARHVDTITHNLNLLQLLRDR